MAASAQAMPPPANIAISKTSNCLTGYVYYLRQPADMVNACTVPSGFTYDRAASGLCDSIGNGGAGIGYRIRVPVNGLWACNVPFGFTYSAVRRELDACWPGSFTQQYALIK